MHYNKNYIERLLESALCNGATRFGWNYNKANEYLKTFSPDRRFKLFCWNGTCSSGWNQHGTVQYMNCLWSFKQSEGGFTVNFRQYGLAI